MNNDYDIIIAGAGPAGAALATLLSRSGRRVALLDAATFPRQKVCGEYLAPLAWQVLAQLGLAELRSRAAPFERLQIVPPHSAPIDIELVGDESARPAGLSRWILDAALVKQAVAAGARLFTNYRVREVLLANGCIVGVVASAVDQSSETVTLRAPALIAADGRTSVVVRQTGHVVRRGVELVGYKRHFAASAREPISSRAISMFALPGTYLGVCRVDDGALNVCGMMSRPLLRRFHGEIGQALQSIAGVHSELGAWLAEAEPLGPWSTVPEVVRLRASPRLPGVLYVGDAMGTIEPLTGQGMTMALVAATFAAEAIVASNRGIDQQVQQQYRARWEHTFAGTIKRAAWFGRMMRHPGLLAKLLAVRPVREHVAPRLIGAVRQWLTVSADVVPKNI